MKTEAQVQQHVKFIASKAGLRLWRNNIGAVTTHDNRHIRFGLGNESAALNKHIKSSDLIGITPVIITPDHIGKAVGLFTAYEVKHEGWIYKGSPRETAQLAFLNLVVSLGGIGKFTTGEL